MPTTQEVEKHLLELAAQRAKDGECPACGGTDYSDAQWYCASREDGGCGFSVSREVCQRVESYAGHGEMPDDELAKVWADIAVEALAYGIRLHARES